MFLKKKLALPVPRGLGPWGGHGGMEWDDGVFLAIHELHLYVGDSVIHAIRVLYQSRNGEPVLSSKHGGEGGEPTDLVNKYITIITITMLLFKYGKKIAIIILKHHTKMLQYHACVLL